MKTLGKPHYVLNQDFYYWKNDKMNKVSKGQEYTWNGCAYSPKNYDEKLNKGITIGEDFVENGVLFDKIKSDKDLSKDFAIIFGIKPREVPSKSSGVEGIKQQLEQYSNMENSKLDETLARELAWATQIQSILEDKADKQVLKEQTDKLKSRSEMEDAELGSIGRDSRKHLTEEDCRQQVKEQSRFLDGSISHQPSPKTAKTQTENVKYQVNFKADKASILISENMLSELMTYDSRSNINGYNTGLNLLWASDEDTGEMICLDSSSILSITKVK